MALNGVLVLANGISVFNNTLNVFGLTITMALRCHQCQKNQQNTFTNAVGPKWHYTMWKANLVNGGSIRISNGIKKFVWPISERSEFPMALKSPLRQWRHVPNSPWHCDLKLIIYIYLFQNSTVWDDIFRHYFLPASGNERKLFNNLNIDNK
jgi:hypothetical protein